MITSKQSEIPALTGIRAVAAYAVVAHHFRQEWETLVPALGNLSFISENGGYGVSLFFILSGFILTYVYDSLLNPLTLSGYRSFVWNRFCRIYPVHFSILLFLVLTVGIAQWKGFKYPVDQFPWSDLPWHFTMLQAWGIVNPMHWNYPSWSISAEWFAYTLVFPIFLPWTRWIHGRAPLAITTFLLLSLYLFLLQRGFIPMWSGPLVQIGFLFVSGILLARMRLLISTKIGEGLCWVGLTAVLLSFYELHKGESRVWEIAMLSGFAAIILGLSRADGIMGRGMSNRGIVYLGTISYSLYMTHTVTSIFLRALFPIQKYGDSSMAKKGGVFLIEFLVVTLVAALCYHIIEVPIRERLRRSGGRKSLI
ncbi:MAG: acyltransferase [Verrucomicrobiota bacterium]